MFRVHPCSTRHVSASAYAKGPLTDTLPPCAQRSVCPAQDGSFDVVTCMYGLFMMPDHGAALREGIRVLRPGGLLAFCVWGPDDKCQLPQVGPGLGLGWVLASTLIRHRVRVQGQGQGQGQLQGSAYEPKPRLCAVMLG